MKLSTEPQDVVVKKGTKVLVRMMTAKFVSLAGMQMKAGVDMDEFEGVVTHIYGDKPENPTRYVFMVKKEDGTEVQVAKRHIVAVIKEAV